MGGMFSKPKVPKPVEPKVIPMANEAKLEQVRRTSQQRQRARSGRQSTMLSERDTLG